MRLEDGRQRAREAAWAKHGADHSFRYRHPVLFWGFWSAVPGFIVLRLAVAGVSSVDVGLPAVAVSWPSLGVWWWVLGAAGVLAGWRAVRWLTTY